MRKRLEEVADVTKLAGFEFTKYMKYIDDGEIVAIRALNLKEGRLVLDDVKHIAKSVSEELPRSQLHKYDIVLSYTGTIGESAQIMEEGKYHLAPNVAKVVPKCDVIDPRYLFQYICSREFKQQMKNYAHGSTQPTVPMATIRELTVPVYDIETEKKIANILSSIGDKIEKNIEINGNLEEQLLAYYRELFVTNAKPTWKIGTVADLGNVVGGSTPSKKREEYYTEHGIAWITPKDLSNDRSKFITHGEIDITELGLANSSAVRMPPGTVLFSSRAPIGYIAIADGEVTTNQGFKSVVPFGEIGTSFVYCFLKENLTIIENMASGSTFKEISGITMKVVPAIIPDSETLSVFRDYADALFNQQRNSEAENRRLSAIRDSLLPRLMSGELDVSDLDL